MLKQSRNKVPGKFNITLPNKKNNLLEYSTWRKVHNNKNDRNSKIMKGQQSLRSLLLTLSKSNKKKEGKHSDRQKQKSQNLYNTSRDFVIKGLVSKTDPTSYCKITIKGFKDNMHLKYKLTTVKNLYEITANSSIEVIGYRNVPQNLSLDFYLTMKEKSLEFLNGCDLMLEPIYKQKYEKVSLNSFQILKCIGTGGFSKVFLCRFKEDGKFYAMKVIDKDFILRNKKKKIVMNEKNIMAQLSHPFLIQMKFAFESKQSLIFVLELCPGGQLFSLVKKFRYMDQEIAKFYIIEILLGLDEIHKNHIIYRDFKPENILIDIDGHIRIADFGLAKPNITSKKGKAYSFCGSPEYMPPQMILKKGHSFPVDFYCLGALLYELVTGLPPFYSRNADQIYQSTINKEITFPKHAKISTELKSLLRQLLCKEQNQRLGSYVGVKEVLAHPWFEKINKKSFFDKKEKPPVNFLDIKDLTFTFDGTEEENVSYVDVMVDQQKKQMRAGYSKAMENFYFDSRQKVRQSCKEKENLNCSNFYLNSTRRDSSESRRTKRQLSNRSKTSLQKIRVGDINSYSSRCLNINNFLR